ncbi:MAG: methyltransferase domain-containing protein [Candidatus Aenigmarchaeota archaeon]|nr:methyltransferase domain-containing protein [Candidatus Aenigmarchaeota archaeon]
MFPFPSNSFDEVYSRFLFEHLTNPLHFLKECYRVLKKGGRIVIITDNAGFFGWLTSVHQGGYEDVSKKKGADEDKHYALFTPSHLKNWLEKVGFKNVKVEYTIDMREIDGRTPLKKSHIPFILFLSKINRKWSPHIKAVGIK